MDAETLIQSIVDEVKYVRGVQAIVLGGSRARGTHTSSSDIDLGIYYDPKHPPDLDELADAAARLDDGHRTGLVTPIGGWGPWINGGGWLVINAFPVDFLYRDLRKVKAVIADCLNGRVEIFYQPGHPYGFVSSIYLGEVAVCQPLWDPQETLAALKKQALPYPDALQKAVMRTFAWEIGFSIEIAKKSIERRDVVYAAGCCFRGMMCMLQVLFALNREYWLNEKGAVAMANRFSIIPASFQQRAHEIFHLLDADPGAIQKAITILMELSRDVDALTKGEIQPK